jgi:hypothetical protein
MAAEPTRSERPRTDWPEAIRDQVEIWQGLGEAASHIAHAKRALFLAYVAEGFNESQALELVKTI